ncbi:MAG: MFS transporter, partial [Rhodospirillaceae bacterium]
MVASLAWAAIARTGRIDPISGSGWAVGYLGGLVALVLTLCLLAENGEGRTLIGRAPIFGLDPETREGTRSVGPFAAIWYVVFMIPFFLWVKESGPEFRPNAKLLSESTGDLISTLRKLPQSPSL